MFEHEALESMKYICVRWIHTSAKEPELLYSELDDQQWELRKVELFADGRVDYAGQIWQKGSAWLSLEPRPLLDEISLDPQCVAVEINQEEFETVWADARRQDVASSSTTG